MKVAVIEYASDDAMAPDVCVGSLRDVLSASAVAMHAYMVRDPDQYADTLDEAGDPREMRETDELFRWHFLVHDAHTVPWVTFYDVPPDEVCGRQDSDLTRRLMFAGEAL